ncbi:MAG: 3-ketoacyl-ACP reductase [Pseudomonadota bacterium]
MPDPTLKTKLSELEARIDKAEARLRSKDLFSANHQVTAAELRQRYRVLSERLQGEINDAEAHGHHVGNLELSVRQWLDSLEIDMD